MLLHAEHLLRHGFAHSFATRDASDAQVLARLGVDKIERITQVHGARVAVAPVPKGTEADAVLARALDASASQGPFHAAKPIAVAVQVADCVPLLLADSQTGDVAAVHAGWRGVVLGVVGRAARELSQKGPLLAAIGPCIGACCFEVGDDVAAQIARACEAAAVVRTENHKTYVDLRGAVRAQLLASGLANQNIEDVAGCTKHEAAKFCSYRRDGAASGRMLAAIVTRPARSVRAQ